MQIYLYNPTDTNDHPNQKQNHANITTYYHTGPAHQGTFDWDCTMFKWTTVIMEQEPTKNTVKL